MVNNKRIREVCVNMPLFCSLLIEFIILLISINSYAQNISKQYTSTLQSNGMLYYIFPQNGFKNKDINNKFIYDLTYLTENDTIVVNFSYFDKQNLEIDSIAFTNGNKKFISTTKKIFVETTRLKWHYRYTSNFLFNDLKTFFSQENPPSIIIYTKQGLIDLIIKTKRWKKQSSIINKIITLIAYNKK